MNIRKALISDIPSVAGIYSGIHSAEEKGECHTGWIRNIYPTSETAKAAVQRNDLYVLEYSGSIAAAAIINNIAPDAYKAAPWKYTKNGEKAVILHTLAVSYQYHGLGLGRYFVEFFESFSKNLYPLRLDTNEINSAARSFYKKLGYSEVSSVETVFNNIPDTRLVLFEKAPL